MMHTLYVLLETCFRFVQKPTGGGRNITDISDIIPNSSTVNRVFSDSLGESNFLKAMRGEITPENTVERARNTIYEMLKRRKKDANKNIPYVFHKADGKQLKEVSKHYDRVIAGLGFYNGITDDVNKVVFHTLRHTFASWLAMAGVDIYTIKELMGHSDIKMTMRYAHLAPNKFKDAVEAVEL